MDLAASLDALKAKLVQCEYEQREMNLKQAACRASEAELRSQISKMSFELREATGTLTPWEIESLYRAKTVYVRKTFNIPDSSIVRVLQFPNGGRLIQLRTPSEATKLCSDNYGYVYHAAESIEKATISLSTRPMRKREDRKKYRDNRRYIRDYGSYDMACGC